MRFLSLFSGIEAASCAWKPIGWQCAAVAEIEPFPSAVLAHHYPSVPNLGDVTKVTQEQVAALGHIDVVCGGFPCQDLSVAGKRKGFTHADGSSTRSGLFFDAMRIAEWAKPRWILIENVPGMFSSNDGRDFAAVVGAMAGSEFDVPRDGWRNAGVVVGPRGLVEWTVLDAQHFGLAQRRRRVFLVRDSGDWAGRPPLFLNAYRLQGHPAPRREAGQTITPTVRAGAPNGGAGHGARSGDSKDELIVPVAPTIPARSLGGGWSNSADHAAAGYMVPVPHADISPAIKARDHKGASSDGDGDGAILVPMVTHSLTRRYDSSEDGCGRGTPLVPVAIRTANTNANGHGISEGLAHTLDQAQGQAIAFDTTQITSAANFSNPKAGDPCHPLAAGQHSPAVAFAHQGGGIQTTLGYDPDSGICQTIGAHQTPAIAGMQVRRLTSKECARLQGFPDHYLDILFRGKPAADGPKYKSLGNSMVVPCMAWIGQRIAQVDAIQDKEVP